MNWPFGRKKPENRGTLTLLSQGNVIIGMPHDSSAEVTAQVADGIKRWKASDARLLVFPFPIDVDDKR